MSAIPTADQMLEFYDSLSNWGRWGDDDTLGTLNLITDEARQVAAGLVRRGRVVSCAHDVVFGEGDTVRFMTTHGEALTQANRARVGREHAAVEWVGLSFHGYDITHLDALSHAFWDGTMYGGRPSWRVSSRRGATALAVTDVGDGIVGRGVLLDIAALRGAPWLEPSTGVLPEDLEAAEATEGVRVQEGDIVLLNTGQSRRKHDGAPVPHAHEHAGWHAACLPWLHERGVAAIGCDTANDVHPSGYEHVSVTHPVHSVGLCRMGLFLIDNMDLVDLALACSELGQWEFLFTLSPLKLRGATGSPVNPLAIF